MPDKPSPSNHTPLTALPAVSLDLETTGLAVDRDRVIQVGLVTLEGPTILERPRLDQRIDPGVPVPETARRITGLSDDDLAGAPSMAMVFPDLAAAIAGRIVIGHHIAFDLAILRHEAARLGVAWDEPAHLDVAHVLGGLEPSLPDLGMETIAAALGVTIVNRHDALGDAMAVAEIHVRLLDRLRAAGVRTLGEAVALADQRQDLKLREAEAGWHGRPRAGADPGIPPADRPRLDGVVFSRRVAEVMSQPVFSVAPGVGIREAAAEMIERRIGAVLVGEPGAPPIGIVTERDLLKTLAAGAGQVESGRLDTIMSAPVATIAPDELLYRALGRMDHLGVRHLAVAGPDGVARGMISQRDLLHHRARAEGLLADAVDSASSASELAAAFARVTDAAHGLINDGMNGLEVARVISRELRAVTGRAADLAVEQLETEGMGPAPAPWCLLVLGSGGRGESLLSADQDNAVIHAGTDADDSWFAALGGRIAEILDAAGIPKCSGGVMAANAPWRGTVDAWRQRIEHWLQRARPEDLLNVDIFFDLQPVAGDTHLGEQLRLESIIGASGSRPFLGLMAQSVTGIAPRFGLFGRLAVDGGRIDLKRQGLLPLVSLARALALSVGSAARSTGERLSDVAAAGRIGNADEQALNDLQSLVMTLMLRQQLADLDEGIRPSSRVAMAGLNRIERDRLKNGLKRLAAIVGDVRGLMMG